MTDIGPVVEIEIPSTDVTVVVESVVPQITVLEESATVTIPGSDETVTVLESAANVSVADPTVGVVSVGAQGPAGPTGATGATGVTGPQGLPGLAGGVYVFTQSLSSATWTINHNLGYYLPVVILDSTGEEVEGTLDYVNANTIIITFTAPFSGTAYVG